MIKIYLAVDADDTEWIYNKKPFRGSDCNGECWTPKEENISSMVELPKGTIKKLIGKDLTWNDEPYEYLGDT